MSDYEHIEKEIEKHYKTREKRKRKRMSVTGKSVFLLQKLMSRPEAKRRVHIKKKK